MRMFFLVTGCLGLAAAAGAEQAARGGWTPAPAPLIAPAGRFQRTVIVSPVGTPQMNGAALLAALASIPGPSQANPWLLKVEPGVYDLGCSNLTMLPYVYVEGSGEETTLITAAGEATDSIATVNGADHAELRQVTVEAVGGAYAKAFYTPAGTKVTHVTGRASGGTTANYGFFLAAGADQAVVSDATADVTSTGTAISWGVLVFGVVTPRIQNVHSRAFGGAEAHALGCLSGSAPVVVDFEGEGLAATTVNRGVTVLDSSPRLRNVAAFANGASGFSDGIAVFGMSAVDLAHVAARATSTAGQATGLYNGPGTTPSINDLLVTAQGATDAWGMNNDGIGGPPMDHVTASAFNSGGMTNTVAGVRNSASSPVITHLTALAVGGAQASGVLNVTSSNPLLTHVTARAQGGQDNAGIRNRSGSNVQVVDGLAVGSGGVFSSGVDTAQASVTLTSINAQASGATNLNAGVVNTTAVAVALRDVVAQGANGLLAQGLRSGSTGPAFVVTVDRSTLQGNQSISNGAGATVNVGASKLMGAVGGAGVTCIGSYNASYVAVSATCQ